MFPGSSTTVVLGAVLLVLLMPRFGDDLPLADATHDNSSRAENMDAALIP